MATKRKAVTIRQVAPKPAQEFVLSAGMIKWIVGTIAALFAGIVAWNQLWDRIDTHWRLEKTQAAQDAKIAADIQTVKEKAESDNKRLAQRAEVGRAWLFYSIADAKAFNAQQWAVFCKALKLPQDACDQLKDQASQYRQEATAAKSDASAVGKEK